MLEDYDISFSTGTMITGAMLSKMCYAPRKFAEYVFKDFSDGIISGMDIKISGRTVIITSGIYKNGSKFFILSEDEIISNSRNGGFSDGGIYFICIRTDGRNILTSDSKSDGVTIHSAEICLRTAGDMHGIEEDIILCNFKGFPSMPARLSDFTRNTFNIIRPCHSMYREPTFHKAVFRAVYRKLKEKSDRHPLDYTLMLEISRCGVVPMQMIRDYVAESGENCDNLDYNELFSLFVRQIDNLHLKINILTVKPQEEKIVPPSERGIILYDD